MQRMKAEGVLVGRRRAVLVVGVGRDQRRVEVHVQRLVGLLAGGRGGHHRRRTTPRPRASARCSVTSSSSARVTIVRLAVAAEATWPNNTRRSSPARSGQMPQRAPRRPASPSGRAPPCPVNDRPRPAMVDFLAQRRGPPQRVSHLGQQRAPRSARGSLPVAVTSQRGRLLLACTLYVNLPPAICGPG